MAQRKAPEGPRATAEAESEVAAFLMAPSTYGGAVQAVEAIETHAARVFLAGDKAYKIKKPVRLPFLDFSTFEARRRALARELELNRPHAPEIYLDLVPVTRTARGGLALGGDGAAVEWALVMNRFEQSHLMSEVADKGPLDPALCRKLAAMIARYHERAPAASLPDAALPVANTLRTLLAQLDGAGGAIGGETASLLRQRAEAALARIADLLRSRALQGAVRRCHGDLHLGNIVLLGERPVPFDALEFDEAMATVDVLYDLAFLLMDLSRRGDAAGANLVLNHYVGLAPLGTEIEGLACLPLFLAMRALVRAVVALHRAQQHDGEARDTALAEARALAAAALSYLDPPAAPLVAVGGFSGTGKSTIAAALAPWLGPAPGALHLRSDVERKRLFGAAETERLSPDHYRPEVSAEVYHLLFNKAERALAAGHGVIVDAVFALPQERDAIGAIAHRTGRPFLGLWLQAPADTLMARVAERRGDASDADGAVVRQQLARNTGPLTWARVDASGAREETLSRAERALEAHGIARRT